MMVGIRGFGSWVLALFLAFMFLQATLHPLPNPPEGMVQLHDAAGVNIIFATLAERTGLDWIEPQGRYSIAGLELAAVFLLIVPRLRRWGALLSSFIMAGAVSLHLVPGLLGRELPRSLKAGEGATDGGALFALAIAMLTASLLLYLMHPRTRLAAR